MFSLLLFFLLFRSDCWIDRATIVFASTGQTVVYENMCLSSSMSCCSFCSDRLLDRIEEFSHCVIRCFMDLNDEGIPVPPGVTVHLSFKPKSTLRTYFVPTSISVSFAWTVTSDTEIDVSCFRVLLSICGWLLMGVKGC